MTGIRGAKDLIEQSICERSSATMALYDTVASLGLGIWSPASWLLLSCVAVGLYALYQRLLPKPIPGIPYNHEAARSLWGDTPSLMREIRATKEFNLWCVKQVEKLKSPLCQVFVDPFDKPWVLLADWGESQDIMLRRKDFDRSTFISDRMASTGSFHACFKTNDAWKATRQWMQDLMTPSFLNNLVGPAVHAKMVDLVDLWENKALLANGRPFEASVDLNHAALDVMLVFSFGKYLGHSAIGPQRELIAQLAPSKVEVGHHDEPLHFPEAPVDEFLVAAHEATEIIEKITNSLAPKFSQWWLRYTPWYKTTWGTADRVVRQHIQSAIRRLRAGDVQTAIDHMMMREEKVAEKMGRLPDFENQVLVDEVSFGFSSCRHSYTLC